LREHLSRLHLIAFLDEDVADFAAHLGDYFGVGFRLERRGAAVHREHLASRGLGNFNRYRRFRLGLVVLFAGRLFARDSIPGTSAQREGEGDDARAKKNVCHGPSPGSCDLRRRSDRIGCECGAV
jgi:hypothetical protein